MRVAPFSFRISACGQRMRSFSFSRSWRFSKYLVKSKVKTNLTAMAVRRIRTTAASQKRGSARFMVRFESLGSEGNVQFLEFLEDQLFGGGV